MVKNVLEKLLNSVSTLCLLSGNGENVYFGIGHSLEVASWLSRQGFVILGFEGFKCDGVSILPLSDFIADFSSIVGSANERIQKSLQATDTVLPKWMDEVEFIEFVIEDVRK